jgi:hypothetical protein
VGSARAAGRLLWAASRPVVDPPSIDAALAEDPDPEQTVDAALENRVAPLLWRALVASGREGWPGPLADRLRAEHDVAHAQAVVLLPLALEAALTPLVDAGHEPVVFKGPAVAARYPAPGLRPMDDIDVILPPEQHDRALAVLRTAGWREYARSGDHYDTVLTHPTVPDLPLELHRGLDRWRDRATSLSARELWQARRATDVLGVGAFALPPEVELVALAAHAGKPFHNFDRLIWSVDLAVVAATPGLDWDRVASIAAGAGATTVVAVGLHHAARLGADVPAARVPLPPGRLRRAALAPVLDDAWPAAPVPHRVNHRLRYALADGTGARARLFVGEMADSGAGAVPKRAGQALAWAGAELAVWGATGSLRGDAATGPREPRRAGRLRLAAEVARTARTARRLLRGDDLPAVAARLRAEGARATPTELPYGEGLRLARAVQRTLAVLPGDDACLTQSAVLLVLLARRGAAASLVIGVRPGAEFGAHAWVELRGRPLLPTFDGDFARLVEL